MRAPFVSGAFCNPEGGEPRQASRKPDRLERGIDAVSLPDGWKLIASISTTVSLKPPMVSVLNFERPTATSRLGQGFAAAGLWRECQQSRRERLS